MKKLWVIWGIAAAILTGFLTWAMFADYSPPLAGLVAAKTVFLPGKTTAGHYLIQEQCTLCHTPFNGVTNAACLSCHQAELMKGGDSHRSAVFSGPKAVQLVTMDVRQCALCHKEHRPEITQTGGVTVAPQFCQSCHPRVRETRGTHVDFTFDMCRGCHNFHDNSATNEKFLERHAHESPTFLPVPWPRAARAKPLRRTLTESEQDAPASLATTAEIRREWASSAHARGGVNCSGCHAAPNSQQAPLWVDKPSHQACAECHREAVDGFLQGQEGMRLAHNLSPLVPGMARLPMHVKASQQGLTCTACHAAHLPDRRAASVSACLGCHNDSHTLAYAKSSHARLWEQEQQGRIPAGQGVSCASCHFPRQAGHDHAAATVQHNVSANLRPNQKMLESVCMRCHGVPFSLDALADRPLIERNFVGSPRSRTLSVQKATGTATK